MNQYYSLLYMFPLPFPFILGIQVILKTSGKRYTHLVLQNVHVTTEINPQLGTDNDQVGFATTVK